VKRLWSEWFQDLGCRGLTANEIELARTIFGSAVRYTEPRVIRRRAYFFQPRNRLMAPDGNIYVPPDGNGYSPDYAVVPVVGLSLRGTRVLFIHEMTHVWQSQRRMPVRMAAVDRRYGYDYATLGTRAFTTYGIEQQATIVEDYFLVKNGHGKVCDGQPVSLPSAERYERILSPHFA
jgi:hypothetical protein